MKNITFRPLTPTCVARFPPNFAWYRGGPCHHFRSKTFLGPVHSFAARGRGKFGWKRPHRSKLLIILSFIEIKQPNLAHLCRLRTCINPVNFVKKNRTRDPPIRGNYIGKIPFFFSFGAVNPHPWADQGEIWQPCQISSWSSVYPKTGTKQYRQRCLRQILPVINRYFAKS